MIDFSRPDAVEYLANLVADRVVEKLGLKDSAEFITRQEVAELAKVSLSTVDRYAKNGTIVPKKFGRKTLFHRADTMAAIGAEE